MEVRKIVLVGPESTGKSTLARQLAAHFDTLFVPEYARQYLLEGNSVCSPRDLVVLAQYQTASEVDALSRCKAPLLFCDTDLHNLVVWGQHAFGKNDPALLALEDKQHYHLYVLLKPDLAWVNDGTRFNRNIRDKLYLLYRERLVEKQRRYIEIGGLGDTRLTAAIDAVLSLV